MLDCPEEFHQTIMSGQGATKKDEEDEEDEVLVAAKKLADALRAKRAYTNTATFDLKCQVRELHGDGCGLSVMLNAFYGSQICGKGLKGEKEARAHASETGHVEFGEY